MKKFFLLLTLLTLPAYAGIYEDSLSKNDKVFLYFYTPECGTCRAFDSIYDELIPQHKDYKFVKVNARTAYGAHLMQKFRGKYVPYIILSNSKTKKNVEVVPYCAMNSLCIERALTNFKG